MLSEVPPPTLVIESGLPYIDITLKPLSYSLIPNNPVSGPEYAPPDDFFVVFFFCVVIAASTVDDTITSDKVATAAIVNPLFKLTWPPKRHLTMSSVRKYRREYSSRGY